MEQGGNILLSVNAGSSSLKVSVFDAHTMSHPKTSLSVEGIGTDHGMLVPDGTYENAHLQQPIQSMDEAAKLVKTWLTDTLGISSEQVAGIGYRVVHGGPEYTEAVKIEGRVLTYLKSISDLAPNHMPATLSAISAFQTSFVHTSHVACFDTGFFHDVPAVAATLPLPLSLQREAHIRRYGFHGLSYESLLDDFAEHEGEEARHGRVIIAHLGSGASVCAVKDGRPVDMSMGFTPVSGVMMSTRSGDIEPGVLTYLQTTQGLSADDISKLTTYESGLKGVSGLSAEMHTLLEAQHTNNDAALAVELFCYKIKKQIGAYIAVLGGVDSIIFSGGIGERSAEVRARICSDFGFIGSILDEKRNRHNERLISGDGSSIGIHVIQSREDVSIIKQTVAVLAKGD
ncbi:MAG: acetate/propionate family kinase [Candidatus Saccharimonadota bacterium]|jgi:acetate kinase